MVGRRLLRGGPPSRRVLWRSPRAAGVYAVIAGTVVSPLALPVLPPSALASVPLQKVNYNLGETIGWPQLNYGEAGALDRYGRACGLPAAFSGHNSYWRWRPPGSSQSVTIAIGSDGG